MSPGSLVVDVNPLGDLFRQAFCAFFDVFEKSRLPLSASSKTTTINPQKAAYAMQSALIEITTALGRDTNLRLAQTELDVAKALQYAFVALVDEILLNTDWYGKAIWIDYLLEESVFNTRKSGELLFDRIKAAMSVRNQPCLEIAEVYLHCLNLGFLGKYRDTAQWLENVSKSRKNLFFFLYQYAPDLKRATCVLAEPAELNLIKTEPRQRSLADKVRWYLYVLAIFSIPFLISCPLWWHLSSQLSAVTG